MRIMQPGDFLLCEGRVTPGTARPTVQLSRVGGEWQDYYIDREAALNKAASMIEDGLPATTTAWWIEDDGTATEIALPPIIHESGPRDTGDQR